MQITLRKNWDGIPSGGLKPSPFFSGRKKEIELLKNIIVYKKTGSILVGAPRGIGKTDLVYKSLKEIGKVNKIIPVVFNANQIESTDKEVEKQFSLLRTLISRTYEACKDIDNERLRGMISDLYLKATSSSFEESSYFKRDIEKEETKTKTLATLLNLDIALDSNKVEGGIKQLGLVVSTALVFVPSLSAYIKWPLALAIYFLTQNLKITTGLGISKNKSKKEQERMSDIATAEIKYKRDGSLSNLESGLKEFLQELTKGGQKLVFVVDELDKIDSDPQNVIQIIKSLKGLFNHSDALFFFVSGSDVYDAIIEHRKQRSIVSTLFSQRIFINRSDINDLIRYLNKIILSPKHGNNIEKFKSYIIYQAQTDFYYLADALRDHIVAFDKYGRSALEWDENDRENLTKANKQMVLSALLHEGKYLYQESSSSHKNESLLNAAYQTAEVVNNAVKIPEDLSGLESDEKIRQQLKSDLARYLEYSGIFKKTESEQDGKKYLDYIPTNLSGKPITDLKTPLAFEQELIDTFTAFKHFILSVYNFRAGILRIPIQKNVTEDVLSEAQRLAGLVIDIYNKINNVVTELTRVPLTHSRSQEELRNYIDEINNHKSDIIRNNTLNIIKGVLEEKGVSVCTLTDKKELLDSQPNLQSHILNKSIPNIIASQDDRKGVFLFAPSESIVVSSEILSEIRRQKTTLVEFYTDPEVAPKINETKIFSKVVSDFDITARDIRNFLKGFRGL